MTITRNIRYDEIVDVSLIDRTTHDIPENAECYNDPAHGLASHRMVWRATGRDGVQRVFADVLCQPCAMEYHTAMPPTTVVALRAEYARERAATAAADAIRCRTHTAGPAQQKATQKMAITTKTECPRCAIPNRPILQRTGAFANNYVLDIAALAPRLLEALTVNLTREELSRLRAILNSSPEFE